MRVTIVVQTFTCIVEYVLDEHAVAVQNNMLRYEYIQIIHCVKILYTRALPLPVASTSEKGNIIGQVALGLLTSIHTITTAALSDTL